jgi:hypothetical protein
MMREDDDPFARFEDLTRELLKVPKSDLKRALSDSDELLDDDPDVVAGMDGLAEHRRVEGDIQEVRPEG